MFGSIRGESLSSHIDRFMSMLTKMKKAGIPVNNRNSIKKLLDSLPKEWSILCMLIRKEYLDAQSTLADLINTLKSFEMDITKREMNQTVPKVAPSTAMKNLALMTPIGDMGSSSGKTVSYSDKAAKTLNPQLTKLANEHVEL